MSSVGKGWEGGEMFLPIIDEERAKHNMSKDELAKALGVTRRTLTNWQSGATEISVSKLIMLTKMWGCSLDYLLGLETDSS